jgi:hypothetical protein
MRISSAKGAVLLALMSGCGNPEQTAPIPVRRTPVPEEAAKSDEGMGNRSSVSKGNPSVKALLATPMMIRYQTPGALRWVVDLEAPITAIRWSPLKGFSVSSGNEVDNVTSRGEHRWRMVAGPEHHLFGYDGIEAVWSPAFGHVSELKRRGMVGWTREVSGRLVEDANGAVYLLDASAVSVLGPDGKDKWRASLEGVRRIEGPFNCGDDILVQGMSGLKSVAVHLSSRGNIVHTTPLGRGSILLGAGKACEPLVWRDGTLSFLNQRGYPRWKREYATAPFVRRLPDGFAVIAGRAGLPAQLEIISMWGKTMLKSDLPVAGRLTTADIIPRGVLGVDAVALCLDVTNPCAKPEGNRGPYNALVTDDGKGGFRTLVRHIVGHLGFAEYLDEGIVVASSKEEYSVDLVLRGLDQSVVWQLTLPGRLSAGPYVGPYGGVYVATCRGWLCEAPYRLYSITGKAPAPDDEEEAVTE